MVTKNLDDATKDLEHLNSVVEEEVMILKNFDNVLKNCKPENLEFLNFTVEIYYPMPYIRLYWRGTQSSA